MKTRYGEEIVKNLHIGTTFAGCKNFSPGVLPTKRQVLENFPFSKLSTADAANDVANKIYDRWVWCSVYPLSSYLTKKLQSFVAAFSKLDWRPKKKRGKSFGKEAEF